MDIKKLKTRLWAWLRKPSLWGWPVGIFVLFAASIFAVASFQAAMHITNTNSFCFSCHIGMDTIVEEYQASAHYAPTRDSVEAAPHARCSDCHVPREFFAKMETKIKASADVWYMIMGKINMDNFEQERPRMAEHIWQQMLANDSKQCRYCHEEADLLAEEKPQRARLNHLRIQSHQETCIDCHYGIAHKRPSSEYKGGL